MNSFDAAGWITAEMRWFWPSEGSAAPRCWFSGGPAAMEERRTDSYLVLPGCRHMGIKLREGVLEFKALVEEGEDFLRPAGQAGRVEKWIKWLLEAPCPTAFGEMRSTGTWREVTKERLQRRFAICDGSIDEVSDPSALEEGCSVELCRVSADDRRSPWFSFAFEAFGQAADLQEILLKVAGRFLEEHGNPPGDVLCPQNAFSYPGWLSRLS